MKCRSPVVAASVMRRSLSAVRAAGIVMCLAAVCVACSPAQQQSAKRTADDALIAAQARAAITAIDPATVTLVSLSVRDGIVSLSGEVPSPAERTRIERVVRGIAGVRGVRDRLRINPKAPTAREIADDLALQARIQAALAAQTGVNALRVGVSVHRRVATLTGSVPNATVHALVVQTARGVHGVARVVDRLRVQG
jgi:osmotically-inducible protein OsmY